MGHRIGLFAGLAVPSAAVAIFVEPWSRLKDWFGDDPHDEVFAQVALGGFTFFMLVGFCSLIRFGLPNVFKAGVLEVGLPEPEATQSLGEVRTLLTAQTSTVSQVVDQLRTVREINDVRAERDQLRFEVIAVRLDQISEELMKLNESRESDGQMLEQGNSRYDALNDPPGVSNGPIE